MFFKDIVGQEEVKQHLLKEAHEHRVPHALLFYGPEGAGKLALALAFARYLLCSGKHPETDNEACGVCNSCKMLNNQFEHPDLHFSFPVIKKGMNPTSDDFIGPWRALIGKTPYISAPQWTDQLEAGNQQPIIYASESNSILHKLSLKSMEGGYKVMIIWLPERMNEACANKLLKLLEEPTPQTVFLMITEAKEQLLPTIVSRTQAIYVPKLKEEEIRDELMVKHGLDRQNATRVAQLADGSMTKALDLIVINEERQLFFDLFVKLMRLAYQRKIREMKEWSEQVAAMGRERQKRFLSYCMQMIRENFVYNFHQPELVHMSDEEQNFATRFAPFINERNVLGIMDELNEAQLHVEQNVNPKMIFFDFSLKMIVLLIQ